MSKRRHTVTTDRVSPVVIPGLFALIPLVYDADLYHFALLPKRIVLQAGLLVLSFVWARRLIQNEIGWSTPATFLPATLFLLWSVVSCVFADLNVYTSTVFLAHQLTFFLTYVVLSQTMTGDIADRILKWTCLSALAYASIGVLEFWGFDLGFIPSNGRPSSTFAYRNFAATFIAAVLPLTLVYLIRCRRQSDLFLASAAALLLGLFLIYTRSRGAWLASAFALTLGGLLAYRVRHAIIPVDASVRGRGWRVPAIALLLLVILSPWSPQITSAQSRAIDEGKTELLDAMSSLTTSGAGRGRLTLWSGTLAMTGHHPVTGVGLGNWKLAYPGYDNGEMIHVGSAPERPHNDFLWILSETGVPGLLAFLGLLAVAVWAAFSTIKGGHPHAGPALAFLCAIVAILIHGFFSFPRERAEASFLLWASLGALHALQRHRHNSSWRPHAPYLVPAVLVLCAFVTILEIRFDRARLASLESFAGGDMVSLDRHTREALAAGPFDSQIYLLRNKVEQGGRNYVRAQQTCIEGLRYHPNSVELLADLGMVYALGNEMRKAEASLLKAAELSPNHYQTFNNLGGVYQKLGELEKAERAYRRATSIKVDYTDAWSNLGLLQMMQGKPDEAVASLTRALDLTANDPVLHHNLADALYLRKAPGDLEKAASHYEHFLRYWRGDMVESEIARSRVAEIRSQP